jgi:nucleotide-binding universal stress UspA family protein
MFKTILVHVDLSSHAPARMRYAATLAHTHGTHLVGAAMLGVSRSIFPHGYDEKPGTLGASYFDPLSDNAKHALSRFEEIATKLQVPFETRFVCDQADDGLAQLARFADLVVVSQDDPAESIPDGAVRLPEYVILNSARPVVVVPRADPPPLVTHRVLVAWNGSKEASCALSAAIPLLRRATEVIVATLAGPDADETDSMAQQPELVNFLARHRVTARTMVRALQHDAGEELLSMARELSCDVLVMGCFGHTQFRELCLGGASRTVLADARIPVLLAH